MTNLPIEVTRRKTPATAMQFTGENWEKIAAWVTKNGGFIPQNTSQRVFERTPRLDRTEVESTFVAKDCWVVGTPYGNALWFEVYGPQEFKMYWREVF